MATMKMTRTLRETANGTPLDAIAPGGAKVEILGTQDVAGAGSWTHIRLIAAIGTPDGWVSSDAIDGDGAMPAAPIDKAMFAKECWRQSLYTGTNAHYLTAIAELRSHIRTGSNEGKTAPFNLTADDWSTAIKNKKFQLDFLPGDIDNWRLQCAAFAVLAAEALDEFVQDNKGKRPSTIDLYIVQLGSPTLDDAARSLLLQSLKEALDATRAVVLAAGAEVLADPSIATTGPNDSAVGVNLGSLSAAKQEMAKLITSKFSAAGYGAIQQIAAVANAIAESDLNPNSVADQGELSVGLFQLNINGGLGSGHTVAELKNPLLNIEIILQEAKKFDAFKNATSIFDAIDVFVRKVERPANPGTQVQKRVKIAERLKGAQTLLA